MLCCVVLWWCDGGVVTGLWWCCGGGVVVEWSGRIVVVLCDFGTVKDLFLVTSIMMIKGGKSMPGSYTQLTLPTISTV